MRDIQGYKSKYGAVGHNKRTLSIETIDGRGLEQVTHLNSICIDTKKSNIFTSSYWHFHFHLSDIEDIIHS